MARSTEAIVDQQVAQWHQELERSQLQHERPSPDVVAVSHSLKSHGLNVGRRVGVLLELPVFDREIVRHIAETAHVHVQTVETLDKRVQNRIDEYTTSLVRERNFDRGDYLRLLSRTVAALWEHGPCVLMGHGCVHLVPAAHALRVRLDAPRDVRAQRLVEERGIDSKEALRVIHRDDAEREAFHRRFFGVDVGDPAHFDLVLNTADLPDSAAAGIIATAYRQKFLERAAG